MSGPPKSTSPGGRYVIGVDMREARMSLWVESPELVDTLAGETLLRFNDSNWSLDSARWQSDSLVALQLRKYPGDHTPGSFEVLVDCALHTAAVGGTAVGDLSGVERELDRLYHAGKR